MSDEYRARLAVELHEAERAAAAPYVSYPPTPWWYSPVIGAWFAAMLAVLAQWSRGSSFVVGLALIGLSGLEVGFIRWMMKRHGAMPWPGKGTPPPEIKRLWNRYFLGGLAVVALVAAVWWQFGVWFAAGAAFVLVTGGLYWYERAYLVAAAEVRTRLA